MQTTTTSNIMQRNKRTPQTGIAPTSLCSVSCRMGLHTVNFWKTATLPLLKPQMDHKYWRTLGQIHPFPSYATSWNTRIRSGNDHGTGTSRTIVVANVRHSRTAGKPVGKHSETRTDQETPNHPTHDLDRGTPRSKSVILLLYSARLPNTVWQQPPWLGNS